MRSGFNGTNAWLPVSRQFNRIFDELMRDAPFASVHAGEPGETFPLLNLWEDDDHVYIEAELPGLSLEDIEIFVKGRELTLSGERKPFETQDATYHRRECAAGKFSRFLKLPVEVDTEKVEAMLNSGVLTVTLPKAEEAKPRKIEVRAV